ncbi:MAG: SusC/RagA family TonB-linked outer membrane protein [Flavicella sp.]
MINTHKSTRGLILLLHLHFAVCAKSLNFSLQQGFTLYGVVKDEYDDVLPGATVHIKGTNLGTQTDIEGKFSLIVPNEENEIIVSYLGYEIKTVKIDKTLLTNSALKVVLFELPYKLDEMVVVGHARVKKSDLTGAVTSIKPKDLNIGNVSNAAQMLQGRIAGLYVNSANQDPGATPDFTLRGVNSLQGSIAAQPLIVIDGFPMESTSILNAISSNDIAQIDVLKDASATAIYGSRGANGVLIITTKSGKNNAMTIDYGTTFSTQLVAKTIALMDANAYAKFYLDFVNDPNFSGGAQFNAPHTSEEVGNLQTTDWQKELIQTVNLMQEHSIAISGGGVGLTYRFSGSFYTADAIVGPAAYERLNVLGKLNFKKNRLNVKAQLGYTSEANNTLKNSYSNALKFSPATSVFDVDGNLSQHKSENLAFLQNPLFNETAMESFTETNTTRIQIGLAYEISKELQLEANLGRIQRTPESYSMRNKAFFFSQEATAGSLQYQNQKTSNANVFLKYKKSFDRHTFDVTTGATYYAFRTRSLSASAEKFPFENIGYYNINAGVLENIMGSDWVQKTTLSGLFRMNYNFDEKFFLTSSYRLDGASQFGENNKWGLFPSIGLAYSIDKGSFYQDHIHFLDVLKVRLGVGVAGNDNIPSFRTQQLVDFTTVDIGGGPQSALINQGNYKANPDLRWEQSTTQNIGLEFGHKNFFAVFDAYRKKTTGVLMDRSLPTETAYDFIALNKGVLENRGVEGKLNLYFNFFSRKLRWSPEIWFSVNKNKILEFDGDVVNYGGGNWIDNKNYGNTAIRQEGYSSHAQWGFDFIGVWQLDEVEEAAMYGAVPGDPKFKDVDKNFVINDADLQYLGDSNPVYTGGFSNKLHYSNFEFSFFIEGVFEKLVVNNNRISLMYPNLLLGRNLAIAAQDRWTDSNASQTVPSLTRLPSNEIVRSDWAMEDASFVRLRNVSVSYVFKPDKLKLFKSVQLFCAATNVFTITKYSGVNPDVQVRDTEWNLQPYTRTVSLGMNATF